MAAVIFAAMTTVVPAAAQAPADFYKGKNLNLVVGYGAGGGYDMYARVLSRHMGRHMPGEPTVVVQNMPGAGSLRAANFVHAVAPKDGLTIGAVDRQMALSAVLGTTANMQFKADEIAWIGTLSSYENDAFILWGRKDAKAKTLEDLKRPGGPTLAVGGAAVGSSDDTVVLVLRDVLKLNVRLVTGYPDGNAIALAVERGELDARTSGFSSIASTRPHWLKPDGPMTPLLAVGRTTRLPQFPDTPIARELAPDERARLIVSLVESPYRLARPYIAPAGLPADRLATLQKAFLETARDPEFVKEAQKLDLDVSPLGGDEIKALVKEIAAAPPDTLAYLRGLLTGDAGAK
ncbi:MAG TPA: tripartite tricarboxylate transporter substrate-binding protein [Beijerinckiaceae bacterium]|jgi:tripartite-type tricarboxylate transporter receptor subunit TctC